MINNFQLQCSFCDKYQNQVNKLIAGDGVYICDECVSSCNGLLTDNLTTIGNTSNSDRSNFSSSNLPKQEEIKKYMDEYNILQEQLLRFLV